ncbi:MAG: zinc-ribbon domain-containing protein [Nitrososphaerales archaeon]
MPAKLVNMSADDSVAKPGYMKRDELVGKSVISDKAVIIGTVKDLAASTDGKIGLHVTRNSVSGSEEVIISADEIQAMSDVILLKPTTPHPVREYPQSMLPPLPGAIPQARTCNRCGYGNGANSRFCIKCGTSLQ